MMLAIYSRRRAQRRAARPAQPFTPTAQAMVLNAYIAAKLWARAPFSQWPRAGESA